SMGREAIPPLLSRFIRSSTLAISRNCLHTAASSSLDQSISADRIPRKTLPNFISRQRRRNMLDPASDLCAAAYKRVTGGLVSAVNKGMDHSFQAINIYAHVQIHNDGDRNLQCTI